MDVGVVVITFFYAIFPLSISQAQSPRIFSGFGTDEPGEWTIRLTPDHNTMHYTSELHAKRESAVGNGTIQARITELVAQ